MKHDLRTAFKPAVRTFAQTLAGGLSALAVLSLSVDSLYAVAYGAGVAFLAAVLAALIAFLQNFAEAIE